MSTIQIYDGEKFVPFNISNAIEMPVGFEDYVSYTELDPGQLIRNGQLVSREIYSDLWNFVQSKPSMLLTEEEWQANLTANEGLACNYYSAGDGSTNFRLPKASVIVLPDPNPENINKYSTDTQRNILGRQVIGSISSYSPTNGDFVKGTTGAFYGTGRQYISNSVWSNDIVGSNTYINPDPTTNVPSGMNTGDTFLNNINFDASKSIGAEHTGEEVKPKSITKLPIVYAFGRIVNAGNVDIVDYVNDNKSSMPLVSEVSRIIINLTAQSQSWTAPCDGYIFARKIGDASVVNSWMNCWNAPNATDVTYGQLLYCDYGQPYINLCGQIPVAKGMTMYFNWNNSAVVYFYPTVNAHYNG